MSLVFYSFTGLGLGVNLPSLGFVLSEFEHSYLSFVLKNSMPLLLAFSLKSPSWIPIRYLSSVSFYSVSHKYSFTVTISLSLIFVLVNFLSVIFHFTNSFFNHDSSIKLSTMLLNYIFSCLNIGSFFKSAWCFEKPEKICYYFFRFFYSILISLTFYNYLFYILYHLIFKILGGLIQLLWFLLILTHGT